jgi:hypothetical protein
MPCRLLAALLLAVPVGFAGRETYSCVITGLTASRLTMRTPKKGDKKGDKKELPVADKPVVVKTSREGKERPSPP